MGDTPQQRERQAPSAWLRGRDSGEDARRPRRRIDIDGDGDGYGADSECATAAGVVRERIERKLEDDNVDRVAYRRNGECPSPPPPSHSSSRRLSGVDATDDGGGSGSGSGNSGSGSRVSMDTLRAAMPASSPSRSATAAGSAQRMPRAAPSSRPPTAASSRQDKRAADEEPVRSASAADAAASTSASRPSPSSSPRQTISYSADRVIGKGSFGVVFLATVVETGEPVAIKKVVQDKRYKNRELQVMRMLTHTNIVELRHCFYSAGKKSGEMCLNLVLEYVPETVYRIGRHYAKVKQAVPLLYVKLYAYQLLRALAYLRDVDVAHRDVKPQNLLVEPRTQALKLCDFGSAKVLTTGEPSLAYIVSRFYRAVELIFGATHYTPDIDLWSAGCVIAELLLGRPLFAGNSGVDQLVEIIKVLGTPSKAEIEAMNSNYTDFKFPHIKPVPWSKVFHPQTDADAVDLVSRLLVYEPQKRVRPMEALAHPFFDELRRTVDESDGSGGGGGGGGGGGSNYNHDGEEEESACGVGGAPTARLPDGKPLPPLFDLTPREWEMAGPELWQRILPRRMYARAATMYAGASDARGKNGSSDDHVSSRVPGS